MKRKLTIAALLIVSVPAFSQFKQSEVVASAGGFEANANFSVSYTIGEPVAGTLKAGEFQFILEIDGEVVQTVSANAETLSETGWDIPIDRLLPREKEEEN